MWFLSFALRRPISVVVSIVSLTLGSAMALRNIPIDIFPKLNLPVIYVCQPYGGMDPGQMEGLLTNYYEFHFLYINGIHHVESKSVHGTALMKLFFHPGTNMAQAMAETITHVNRSRAFMPQGTVPPFVMRFDTGSVPVGYLVLSSETRELGEIQDQALFKVRPMFASLPGVSAPPPFGGNQRTIVLRVDPERLKAHRLSPENVVAALSSGNAISPSGNVRVGDTYPIVSVNSLAEQIADMEQIPIRTGSQPAVYLRDIGRIEDTTDIPTGYALVNGRRAIYMTVTKRADASTLNVVRAVENAIPDIQDLLPDDIRVTFEFDQSPFVERAMFGLLTEGLLGALLTGLMVILFLRDIRSAIVVVLNIPFALMGAVIGLWMTGQTLNLMTLGGLALAVGILVDEATVEIENIHSQLEKTKSVARAIRLGNAQTAVPRLLSMLCILAVFLPALFMEGAAQALFLPLSLAVGFAMIASYLLSNTFVPVASAWLIRRHHLPSTDDESLSSFAKLSQVFEKVVDCVVRYRFAVFLAYMIGTFTVLIGLGSQLGIEIFPSVDTGQFRLRMRAPNGTHVEKTEALAVEVLNAIRDHIGAENIDMTLGYVGSIPSTYPVQAIYQWSRGPEEATLRIALRHGRGLQVDQLKESLRRDLAEKFPDLRFSFEPADIVNEVMTFGSPTPIEVAVNGPDLTANRVYIERLKDGLEKIPALRDLQIAQSLDYPTLKITINREKAGLSGVTAADVARSLVSATSSSRFVVPIYWPDPETGIGYQVQVEVPPSVDASIEGLKSTPVKLQGDRSLLLRDVATIQPGTMQGQFDRYNMRRELSLTANISGADLGTVARQVTDAVAMAGEPPRGAKVEMRGLIPTLRQMMGGLIVGLLLAVLVIFLLLSANFQSPGLAMVAIASVPAALVGVIVSLWVTGTTLNLQSFIGTIMSIGVAMANTILLVTFAEEQRRLGASSEVAAVRGATLRLRPILMTSAAMVVGMIPMALSLGESGEQTSPLGRAVIGGLISASLATLFIVPALFAEMRGTATSHSASLDPDDIHSRNFDNWSPPKPVKRENSREIWVRKTLIAEETAQNGSNNRWDSQHE